MEEATRFADCTLIGLTGAGPGPRRRVRLLQPFDTPSLVIDPGPTVKPVRPRPWMRLLRSRLRDLRAHGELRAAAGAAMEVHAFQLEPAIALVRGRASRFLLADEVGLGKTVQAGLMLAELQHRGWCERALILCPAGLREQWSGELRRRFDVGAVIVDASWLRRMGQTLPFGVNPWSIEPVAIASMDFVKQPEVMASLRSVIWDIVIVDEAHQAATAPLRAAAVSALAERARHVVLVTATPHAGDAAAYASLCAIGQLGRDDPLVLFRRTRDRVGMPRARHVHLLPIRLGPAELAMHRLLGGYARRLLEVSQRGHNRDAQLIATVLSKRAFSSAASLALSVERRLAAMSGEPACSADSASPVQTPFPFDDEATDLPPSLDAPVLDRAGDERSVLRDLLDAALQACVVERKVAALCRLLRRVPEPAIVFTEYRDTLMVLDSALRGLKSVVLLHGGLDTTERRAAIDAFNQGGADLLLSTDAGAEGLNLQSRCRLVINLELPWNPTRLEQRIGRVDRLGQARTVHAFNFIADETSERTVLAGLLQRIDSIRASEIEIAACVIRGEMPAGAAAQGRDPQSATTHVESDAIAEAARLAGLRADDPPSTERDNTGTLATVLTRPTSRIESSAAIWFIRIRLVNGAGRLIEEVLVPILTKLCRPLEPQRWAGLRHSAGQLIEAHGQAVADQAGRRAAERMNVIAAECTRWMERARVRERRLSEWLERDADSLVQEGLFDGRARTLRHDAHRTRRALREASDARAVSILQSTTLSAQVPELLFLLFTC